MYKQVFDIIVNGADIIGLTLACGLAKNFRVAVLRNVNFENNRTLQLSNAGISIVNSASIEFLKFLKIWNNNIVHLSSPYYGIEFWECNNFKKITFDGSHIGNKCFGYIIEDEIIKQALLHHIEQLNSVSLINYTSLYNVNIDKNKVSVTIDDICVLFGNLILETDSTNSFFSQYYGVSLYFYDHQNYILWANIYTEFAHGNIIRIICSDDGLLVVLPLENSNICCILWLLSFDCLQFKLNCSVKEFNSDLMSMFGLILGHCKLYSVRRCYTSNIQYVNDFIQSRLILLGDVGYSVKPLLFGYELSLYFMDIQILLSEIMRLKTENKDIGCSFYLKSYSNKHKKEILRLFLFLKTMHMFFPNNFQFKKMIRLFVFYLIDEFSCIKSQLISKIMGFDNFIFF